MKKIILSAIIALFLVLMSMASFAKTPVSDGELDNITAEAGVTLNFGTGDHTNSTVMVTNWAPSLVSFGDTDGVTGYASPGWIGVSGITMDAASNILVYNSMTIDVGSNGSITKLNLGLPSVMVHPVLTDATIRLGIAKEMSDAQPVLGTFYNDKFALFINPTGVGSVTISSHAATQGIETAFSNVSLLIPAEAIDASWGDADGFTGYASGGYIGVKDYVTSDSMLIALSGGISIDVGTDAGGVTALNVVLPATTINPTLVNISAPLALGNIKDFSDNQPLLGSLNMNGFSTAISGGMRITSH